MSVACIAVGGAVVCGEQGEILAPRLQLDRGQHAPAKQLSLQRTLPARFGASIYSSAFTREVLLTGLLLFACHHRADLVFNNGRPYVPGRPGLPPPDASNTTAAAAAPASDADTDDPQKLQERIKKAAKEPDPELDPQPQLQPVRRLPPLPASDHRADYRASSRSSRKLSN